MKSCISFFLLCLLVLSCACGASPSPIPPHPLPPSPVPTLHRPLDGEGLYEYCAPRLGQTCLTHLQSIAAAGFSLVLNYALLQGSQDQLLTYIQEAQKDRLRLIWPFDDSSFLEGTAFQRFPQLAHTCQCSSDTMLLDFLIPLIASLPTTWGYYVGDEPPLLQHAQVKLLSQTISLLDSHHPRLVVHDSLPLLRAYADTADVLALDDYPIGNTGHTIAEIGPLAQQVQALVTKTPHTFTGFVLQAHSLADYPDAYACYDSQGNISLLRCPYPTQPEEEHMHALVEYNASPRLILWYSYFDIQKSDNPTQRLKGVQQAILSP